MTPNSNAVGNLYVKMKKGFPEAVNGDFLFKIGILWFRDMRNKVPFFKYKVPPLATPTTQ